MIRRLLLALCAPVVLGAQSGGWVVAAERYRDPKLSAMLAHMTEVMSVIRRDPFIDKPSSYTVQAKLFAAQTSARKMVTGRIAALLIPGTTAEGEGLGFNVVANSTTCALGESADLKDAESGFYTPLVSKTVHGFPMYGEPGCIVVTGRPGPITVPVSRERAARALLAQYASDASIVAQVQHELAAMSAEQRGSPAIVDIGVITAMQLGDKGGKPIFAAADGEGRIRLMAPNPAFYDRTRPADVQVIAVSFDCLDGHGSPFCAQYKGVFERIRDGIDWNALAQLVKP